MRNLKELGFGRKSEESVQVLVHHNILSLKHLKHLKHPKTGHAGGGKSSGGASGELLQGGGDLGEGAV